MSKKFPTIALAIALPLLSACGPMTVLDTQRGAWVPIRPATLEIHRDITIPAERTRAFFQDGAQVSAINEFKPFCQLEITTLKTTAQTVHPGTFTVVRVGSKMQEIVQTAPLQVAALDGFVLVDSQDGGSGGPSRITRMLIMNLHSAAQPDVRRLDCGGAFDDPYDADPPTLQEIAAALGGYATLVVK